MTNYSAPKDAKELAYLYDLYFVPGWRESFDQLLDAEVKLPDEGKILEVSCGTGGYAVDLAGRLGDKVQVVAVDDSAERIALANGKAEIKKLDNIRFAVGALDDLGLADDDFDLVITDVSFLSPPELAERLADILSEIRRVAKSGAGVILKLATRGSFDEFYSYYWQALLETELLDYTTQLEELISERYTTTQIESVFREAGFRHVESVTEKQQLDFETATEFITSPLIENVFLGHWLGILASEQEERTVREALVRIIDRERGEDEFDVSAKTTLVIAKR